MMAVLMVPLAAPNSFSLARSSPSLQWLARFGRDIAHLKALEKRYQVVERRRKCESGVLHPFKLGAEI